MTAESTVSGRPIFAAGALVTVLLAGIIGAIVGASGQSRGATMDLLGVVSFSMTPIGVAAFGMVLTAGVLALLFGLVSVASKYDEANAEG